MLPVKQIRLVRVCDWDRLVVETYSRPYNFQQQDGCKDRQFVSLTVPSKPYDFKRDSIPEIVNHSEMGVSFAAWLARDPTQKLNSPDEWDREHGIQLWWERNFYPDVQMIANDLHSRGLLEAGEYGINIDW